MKSELLNVLRRYLRPEFINRIDEIIVFHALDRKQIRDIVGLQLERVKRIAHGQGLTVEFDNSLIDHLADVGYRPEFGARELRRQIRSLIETRLASAVLRGDIEEGDSLRFVYDDDRSEIRWEKEAKVPRVYLRVVGYSAIITPLSIFLTRQPEVIMTESTHHPNDQPASTDTVYGMPAYADRAAAVNEVHTRPHLMIQAPREMLQFAFMTGGDLTKDKLAMNELSGRLRVAEPDQSTAFHGLTWEDGGLHCEKHSEYSTYLWCAELDPETGEPCGENPFKHGFIPPGPVVSGVRLTFLSWTSDTEKEVDRFDPSSLCYSLVESGNAAILTDFRQDEDGLTHILILARDLRPARAGALAQRLLEIETYRTLALLSLPLTRSMTTELRNMESQLAMMTDEMSTNSETRRDNHLLLSELTGLAAKLEACVAANLYRFGASRAYYEIVEERLAALMEEGVSGYFTWRDFLQRRIAPAMRTCLSVKERQAKLSDELTRNISLLRSWVDVELERQNRDLLASMNNRVKLQLRLQQTVEGLSVAAVSYYVVSLSGYFLKGIPFIYDVVTPVMSVLVPVVMLSIWWRVRRIRHAHDDSTAL